jgi:hypothetical protein
MFNGATLIGANVAVPADMAFTVPTNVHPALEALKPTYVPGRVHTSTATGVLAAELNMVLKLVSVIGDVFVVRFMNIPPEPLLAVALAFNVIENDLMDTSIPKSRQTSNLCFITYVFKVYNSILNNYRFKNYHVWLIKKRAAFTKWLF